MVRFTGYAKKEDPKWITVLIYAIVMVLAFILLFAISFLAQWFNDLAKEREKAAATSTTTSTTVTETMIGASTLPVNAITLSRPNISEVVKSQEAEPSFSNISVSQIVLSRAVTGNMPTEDISSVSISDGRIYCFTRIKCGNPPQKIKHEWIRPDGSVYTDIELSISREETFTWSYITLANAGAGEWSVRVVDQSGSVIALKKFSITE